MAKHNDIGVLGELVAQKFLISKGYKIKDVNYREKWGEIDIVAVYRGQIVFVEVKSGDFESKVDPLDHMHETKLKRQRRVIETYIHKNKVEAWQYDVLRVRIDVEGKEARVLHLKQVIL